jgi:hypothetical protein
MVNHQIDAMVAVEDAHRRQWYSMIFYIRSASSQDFASAREVLGLYLERANRVWRLDWYSGRSRYSDLKEA